MNHSAGEQQPILVLLGAELIGCNGEARLVRAVAWEDGVWLKREDGVGRVPRTRQRCLGRAAFAPWARGSPPLCKGISPIEHSRIALSICIAICAIILASIHRPFCLYVMGATWLLNVWLGLVHFLFLLCSKKIFRKKSLEDA